MDKDDGAFLTIGELARELGVAQHILRYWETRFPQLKPLQRSGNRRYYRPRDVAVARQINRLLNEEGFTVRGAQRMLSTRAEARPDEGAPVAAPVEATPPASAPTTPAAGLSANARMQGELPIGDVRASAQSGADQAAPPTRHVRESDLALLIARLTVIRQNLLEAIEPR